MALTTDAGDELFSYLTHIRNCAATDPRDKIFAVIRFPHGKVQKFGIAPNYRSSAGGHDQEAFDRIEAIGQYNQSTSLVGILQGLADDFRAIGSLLKRKFKKEWGHFFSWNTSPRDPCQVGIFRSGAKAHKPNSKGGSPMSIFTLSSLRKLAAFKIDNNPKPFEPFGFLGHLKSTWRSYGDFYPLLIKVPVRRWLF